VTEKAELLIWCRLRATHQTIPAQSLHLFLCATLSRHYDKNSGIIFCCLRSRPTFL